MRDKFFKPLIRGLPLREDIKSMSFHRIDDVYYIYLLVFGMLNVYDNNDNDDRKRVKFLIKSSVVSVKF